MRLQICYVENCILFCRKITAKAKRIKTKTKKNKNKKKHGKQIGSDTTGLIGLIVL